MIKDDKIYQILLKNNFDLYRGEKGVAEYMQQHLSQYYNEISNSIYAQDNPFLGEEFTKSLCKKLELLDEICKEIPYIIELYNKGLIKQAYENSFAKPIRGGYYIYGIFIYDILRKIRGRVCENNVFVRIQHIFSTPILQSLYLRKQLAQSPCDPPCK